MISDPNLPDDPTRAVPGILWTKPKLKKLKKALSIAIKEQMSKEGTFEFEGHTFLIAYACYLVEFLEQKPK